MTQPVANRAAGAAAFAVISAVVGVAIAAGVSDSVRVLDLARDPATLSDSPAHDGVLTHLGGFSWTATITACLIGAWLIGRGDGPRRRVRYLGSAAGVTTLLLIDDIFLIHERAIPSLGLSEEPLFAFYALVVSVLVIGHRDVLAATAWPVLAFSLTVFAVAVARNRLFTVPAGLLPDTLAFIGTGAWMVFHLHTTIAWIEALASRERAPS